MDEQENVNAGSETSGEQEAAQTVQTETVSDQGAGVAAEQKAGDACTCPDGRVGTLHANEAGDGFVCIPNAEQG
jgi:hypothetical protein